MKLKQLLQTCSFNSVAPHLVRLYPDHKGIIYAYKGAYDILRHTEEVELEEEIVIKQRRDSSSGKTYIYVANCEGDSWKRCLGKKLVFENGLVLSNEELAAHCLWSLTFYGFSPNEITHAFDNEPIYASRKEKIDVLVTYLTSNTSLHRKDVDYLYRTKLIYENTYRSRAYNKAQRIPYLVDLLLNYEQSDFSPYKSFILLINTSKENPILANEKEDLLQLTTRLPKGAEHRWVFGIDEELGEEVGLLLVGAY